MNRIPIPPITGTRERACERCEDEQPKECVELQFPVKIDGARVPYLLFYCWPCYRRLVRSIECVNGFNIDRRWGAREAVRECELRAASTAE